MLILRVYPYHVYPPFYILSVLYSTNVSQKEAHYYSICLRYKAQGRTIYYCLHFCCYLP